MVPKHRVPLRLQTAGSYLNVTIPVPQTNCTRGKRFAQFSTTNVGSNVNTFSELLVVPSSAKEYTFTKVNFWSDVSLSIVEDCSGLSSSLQRIFRSGPGRKHWSFCFLSSIISCVQYIRDHTAGDCET